MSDPRFEKFLKDKIENYPFAKRLMDFCLVHSYKTDWSYFEKSGHFPFKVNSPFRRSELHFQKTYARIWMPLRTKGTLDEAITIIKGILGDDCELGIQDGEKLKALHPVIDNEVKCDALINWLKNQHLRIEGQNANLSARDLFQLVTKEHILKAFADFESDIEHEFGPSTQYDLIHEGKPYPPKAILGIACQYVEGGRLLKPEEFSGGEQSTCFRTLRREGFTIEPKQTELNYWIFQCNPKIYDGISALRDNKVHDWSVASHKKKIKEGDLFILYLTGSKSGCYALGKVTSELKKQSRSQEDVLDEYSKELELREDWSDYVEVEISHNFGDRPILKDEIKSNEIFSDFKAGNQGTNFSSTREEYEEIRRIAELKLENYGRRFWLYAPGEQARLWQECRDKSEMFLLWDEIPNLNNFSSKEEIGKAFLQIDDENTNPVNDVLALWEFNEVMNAGDVVIAKEGRTKYLGYGIVEGEYSFDDKRKEGFHNRSVSWKKDGEWKDEVEIFATKTLTDITEFETTSPDYGTYVERLIDLIGIELEDRPRPLRKKRNMINAELIKEFETDCRNAALNYAPRLLERFTASLLAKRFLILTGLSGSGKTKLAQAFAEWICVNKVAKDPFFAGAKVQGSRTTYHVKRSDRLSVEFWNNEDEEDAIKVTLPREIIDEWAEYISREDKTEELAQTIRNEIAAISKYSFNLHSFETHLKPAAIALIEARDVAQDARCFEIIPVGADWTSNENIVGYPDGLTEKNYVSTPALDLILRAGENPGLPHFLILDEMNLSHVERYFADMLSAVESGEAIPLYEGEQEDEGAWRVTNAGRAIPPSVKLPENLFVIGTVNVDETTYMFSPKVLDRANVIEFRVEPADMKAFLGNPGKKPDLEKLAGKGAGYGSAFVTTQASEVKIDGKFSAAIRNLFDILASHDLEFGYRVAHEASRLVHFQKLLGSGSFRPNFDAVIAQKLLPKLHGSRSQLETLLQELLLATSGKAEEDWNEEVLETENPQYPLSFNKLKRMYKKLQRDQFVSFAEA